MKGKVFIVGLGPGDPELMTVKARKLLEKADLILYTGSLLSNELVRLIKSTGARTVNTYGLSEEDIVKELAECVKKGLTCLWVHDGDPSIYGGVARVIKELRRRGINYEVVPGVTSITAMAARLGIPLTAQGIVSGVLVTNPRHIRKVKELPDETAIIVLLSGKSLSELAGELIRLGVNGEEDVAVIRKCFWREGEEVMVVKVSNLREASDKLKGRECVALLYTPTLRIDELDIPKSKVYGGVRG